MNEQLARLAERCGIARSYRDIRGREQTASDATLAALLVAMGVLDEASPRSIEAALGAREARQRDASLPPVIVLPDDAPSWSLPLEADAEWRIELEDGSLREGRGGRELPAELRPPPGYHRLSLRRGEGTLAHSRLVVAPRRAWQPPAIDGDGRVWGVAAQLYALRSQRNWGIGDFTDLRRLVEWCHRHGAGVVGVNPLHAMFVEAPEHASPYSPSSRLFLNVLYLDVEAVEEFAECAAARELVQGESFRERLAALRAAPLVDYAGVASLKHAVLRLLYACFRSAHLQPRSARAEAFDGFRRARGQALRRHALFEAMQAHRRAADASVWGWTDWPGEWRAPDSAAVAEFERTRLEEVEYFEYLQWLADLQLAAVGRRSWELGLGVGLYVDLALAMDRGGAEAWSEQAVLARGVSIGAPPDALSPSGQDWGLPPFDPERLRDAGYAPFIAALRANMFHAGAIRIDHVMALMRLYWIAPGASADAGAYVHYAFDELLAIVALESRRNRCLVIGEDLGTVPPEVRSRLAASGVLSYRVLLFERDANGTFLAPAEYPRQALAVAATHDLPTLAGWWQGRDLALRESLGLVAREDAGGDAQAERARERALLLGALERERLVPAHAPAHARLDAPTLCAVHAFLARTPAQLVLVQAEDMLLALEAVNVPGTTGEVPNWRRRLTLPLEAWDGDATVRALVRAIERERRAPASAARHEVAIPRATYRLQLHREFGFEQARAVVPYLAALGISHLYCSPLLRARPGSRHGYDVVDHTALNPELGTREDFDRLVRTLHEHGMGLVADIVPNHMGVLIRDNDWWLDVLENGPASAYADYFDIEWHAADPSLTGRVLLPILGEQYGVVLERGELRLDFDAARGAFTLGYFEHRLPVDPASYAPLLRRALRRLSAGSEGAGDLGALAEAFERLPARDAVDADSRAARQRDQAALKARLGALARAQPALAQAIDASVEALNGRAGARAGMDALDALIDEQAYRLAHWRVAADEINYRRFFDINELAALRMERPEVFEATHRFVLELAASGAIDGLRVDHPDGLADPAGYFARLQARHAELAALPLPAARGDAPARPLYVVVEKIVAPHEQVPRDWAVHGTTGYRFANVVNALMVDGAARQRLDRAWRAFVRDEAEDFDALGRRCRHVVMEGTLAGELTVLATTLLRLAREDRRTRDFTLNSLRRALAEVVAAFPVYRTYIVERPSAQDRRFIDWAIGRARRRSVAADASVFDFLRRVLLGRPLPGAPAGQAARYLAFARRFQQYTAPVAAKGIEDTALYRHHRLVSLNDVGGDPDMFGLSVAAFHAASRDRALHWPHTLLATSTHDAKRSEDVRARIDVISEMPAAWRLAVRRWSRMNRRHRRIVDGAPAPSRNDEYLLYQTLVGSLPEGPLDDPALARYAERVDAAMLKSARESKAITSWMNPHAAYESALSSFVRALLARRDSNLFLDDLEANAAVFAWYGALNGLTIATLKCLSPGVPDIYQGHEAIELALVDPDNRRAVDFEQRREWLAHARTIESRADRSVALHEMLAAAPDGRAKFWATWRCLNLRRDCAAVLDPSDYRPLEARGARAAHVVAFARRAGAGWIVAIGARLYASLGLAVRELPIGDAWADTEVLWPESLGAVDAFDDAIGGSRHRIESGALRLADVLRDFPVAALHGAMRA